MKDWVCTRNPNFGFLEMVDKGFTYVFANSFYNIWWLFKMERFECASNLWILNKYGKLFEELLTYLWADSAGYPKNQFGVFVTKCMHTTYIFTHILRRYSWKYAELLHCLFYNGRKFELQFMVVEMMRKGRPHLSLKNDSIHTVCTKSLKTCKFIVWLDKIIDFWQT